MNTTAQWQQHCCYYSAGHVVIAERCMRSKISHNHLRLARTKAQVMTHMTHTAHRRPRTTLRMNQAHSSTLDPILLAPRPSCTTLHLRPTQAHAQLQRPAATSFWPVDRSHFTALALGSFEAELGGLCRVMPELNTSRTTLGPLHSCCVSYVPMCPAHACQCFAYSLPQLLYTMLNTRNAHSSGMVCYGLAHLRT